LSGAVRRAILEAISRRAAVPKMSHIVPDTLGKVYGHGIGGYCLVCQRIFDVPLPALIKERGGAAHMVGKRPWVCPDCGGRRTTFQVTAPRRGG
jgi:rubredoxin